MGLMNYLKGGFRANSEVEKAAQECVAKGITSEKEAKSYLKKKGFTLVELLVTIASIAVLAGMGAKVILKAQNKVNQATCLANLTQLQMATAMYAEDNNGRIPATGVGAFGYDATPYICIAGKPVGPAPYIKYGNVKMLGCSSSNYATPEQVEKAWNAAIASGSGDVIGAYTFRGKSGFPGLTQEQYDALHFYSKTTMGKTLFMENNYIYCGTKKINHEGNNVGGIDFDGSGLRRIINEKTADFPDGVLTVRDNTNEEYTRVLEEFDSK